MPAKPIPAGLTSVTPYLTIKGVPRLIDFMTRAFGATEDHRTALPDGRVMHAQPRIDGAAVMMGEAQPSWPAMPGSIYLYVPDADVTYRKAIEAGGESIMEPADQFYGDRMAGVRDPCGNVWWIATHVEDVPPDELARRTEAATKQ